MMMVLFMRPFFKWRMTTVMGSDKQLKQSFMGYVTNEDVGNERVIINLGFG